ncbi:cytochrome c family protein (plasmid) [Ruegeria pomeroyi DSS-3]|uniref:Cytochrome c family protein n=2 Tax=Ruegeria pomeroyi TaxID=89184 RepID=Q5LL76_RUEPO|nr:c-type cytochrome [Ruegeria pomeroyi]AAV97287.1 cytochrome c family protein [Ruegeria pomeroyi DSS-3]NVK96759.1 c-type cytochrome [Ruegeria pomeroyi]NVK99976.1 c-type cytochrome [Ruegeria pomeroyi]HCE70039.1 cytochrome c family protein [Ruegeria sp.]
MIFRAFSVLVLPVALLAASAADADGAALYAESCAGCHGETGQGNGELRAPALAALDAGYLIRQVGHFRSGVRQVNPDNDMAVAMVELLPDVSEADTAEIASYLASLPLPVLEDDNDPPGFRSRGLYSGCISCHGARAQGIEALNAPRLARQYGWYLAEQLDAFRVGRRGAHPEDDPGRQMKAMADAIGSEADIAALVSYIATLDP